MTVRDLIAVLRTMDPDAAVIESNHSECRALTKDDVCFYPDTDIETDDGEVITGKVVIFRAFN